MRSEGQVRFITISSRVQMTAAAITLAALIVWTLSVAIAGWAQYRATADRLSLLDREAKVATAEERVDAYRDDIDAVASDLVKRQEFIEDMVTSLPADAKGMTNVSDSSGEAAKTVDKVSVSIPEAAALARIEARQLAFVEGLTRYADWRAQRAASALKQLGIDPRLMLSRADRTAVGGPLEKLATSRDGSIDPRFERLGLSIARMAALENGLAGVPQVEPAALEYISSGFGYRRDPFTGVAAMHKGLDFRGPTGTPIYAAANGVVSFVGRKSGFGKVVEINHGNGLMTRYAHMSAFNSKVGQKVVAGETIGAIGSTGRSTGPHLHFEVRINDRAVNPRTFLETAPHVLEEIRRAPQLAHAE
ncbi:M23 family metallopeptidase [Erythrobacter mangrovi]|uniref:M23 family metallopeptidase n=2 Tax=Erythrobacter mangrovi TaxID=2739433 RepID=A0A7D4B9D5_9SPHN|nr:M23 family metallopeptidase [Erythrobacter mangrovi]